MPKLRNRKEVEAFLRKVKKGTTITIVWADAAEIRQLSISKLQNGKIPQRLLETVMQHTGEFLGIQREKTSRRNYVILLLANHDGKVDVATIPTDLIFQIKVRQRKREMVVVKVPMMTKKYPGGELKESGGVIKVAE